MVAEVPILIIGAGPAGLALAGRLTHRGMAATIVEAADRIASSWHGHYDRLHLHTVNQWSHLPHLPFPDDFPVYVPKLQLIEYFDRYVEHFNIRPLLECKVRHIERQGGDLWSVRTDQRAFLARHLVIASGVNRVTHVPIWANSEDYKGEIIHSRQYKNSRPFRGKKVLIVGMGNTGAELALDLSEHNIDVSVSVRSPISVVPRDLFGRPVQVTSKRLQKIPFGIGGWIGNRIRSLYFGDLSRYGLPISEVDPVRLLSETGKTPVIDIGTMAAIKSGHIHVRGDVQGLHRHGVAFANGAVEAYDSIILATGYRAQIEDFFPLAATIRDSNGLPSLKIGEGSLANVYFLGFDNYKLGGILGTIYQDSALIADQIEARLQSSS